MNAWRILERWYERKLNIKRIDKYFDKISNGSKLEKSLNVGSIDLKERNNLNESMSLKSICVSCVQREIKPVKSVEEFIDILAASVKQAADAGSKLVVFPEYNFFDLFGLLPGFCIINRSLTKKAKQNTTDNNSKDINSANNSTNTKNTNDNSGLNDSAPHDSPSAFAKIFQSIAQPVSAALLHITSQLAKAYGVYIYTGSYLIRENGILYNSGSLFGPDGNRIGSQHKIHLTGSEVDLGLGRGSELKVFKLPIGNVAFPICMDATYFETFRVAVEQGADIVLLPIADMDEYNTDKALRGIWPRVQESQVYGLKASLNGWIAGIHFTGKAGIFAPLPLTLKCDGVTAMSKEFEGNQVITAVIDIERLREERMNSEYYGDSNPAFEAGYVARVYS